MPRDGRTELKTADAGDAFVDVGSSATRHRPGITCGR
jgi:hypothetical protein